MLRNLGKSVGKLRLVEVRSMGVVREGGRMGVTISTLMIVWKTNTNWHMLGLGYLHGVALLK